MSRINKTNSRPEYSAYRVFWAEFFPAYGVVTKHDRKQLGEIMTDYKSPKTYRRHFPSKAKAVEFLTNFDKNLDKSYTVRLFSDRQFSLAKESEDYRIHYTRKQWIESYEIGNKTQQ